MCGGTEVAELIMPCSSWRSQGPQSDPPQAAESGVGTSGAALMGPGIATIQVSCATSGLSWRANVDALQSVPQPVGAPILRHAGLETTNTVACQPGHVTL